MMALSYDRMSLRIDGVTFTTVSDVVQDAVSGGYVRLIQFFTDAVDATNPRPVLEITLTGDAALDVELQTPKLNF
jgi:hypothetical protein